MPGIRSALFSCGMYRAARLVFAAIFLLAGSFKAASPEALASVIAVFDLVPASAVPFLSVFLPLAECLVAVLLLFDLKGALGLLTALLVLYLGVLWHGIMLELGISCDCFGPDMPGPTTLFAAFWRNLVFLALAGYLYAARYANPDIRPRPLFGPREN